MKTNLFNPDFKDFIRCLHNAKVEYILVGGYAVIIHGYSRTTGDMDIWVNKTKQNYSKIIQAFAHFGMPTFDMTEDKFLNNPAIDVFSFGVPPVRIDLITEILGLEFNEAIRNVEIIPIQDDLNVNVLSKDDLISAKTASNRYKDLDDLEHLR